MIGAQRFRQYTTHLRIQIVVIESYSLDNEHCNTILSSGNEHVIEALERGHFVEVAVVVDVHLRDEVAQDLVILLHLAEGQNIDGDRVLCEKEDESTNVTHHYSVALLESGVVLEGTAHKGDDARLSVGVFSVLQHQLRLSSSRCNYLSHRQSSVKIALSLLLQLLRGSSEFVSLARQRGLDGHTRNERQFQEATDFLPS